MYSYEFIDGEFRCLLNSTGLYLKTSTLGTEEALNRANRILDDLAIDYKQAVLVVIVPDSEYEQRSSYLNVVHNASAEQLIGVLMENRDYVLSDRDVKEILECYDVPDNSIEQEEWYYDYSRTMLYRKLREYRMSKSDIKHNGLDVLSDRQIEEIVKKRPTMGEELRVLGVREQDYQDILYLIELCPIEDPIKRMKDTNLMNVKEKKGTDYEEGVTTMLESKGSFYGYVGIALSVVSLLFFFLGLPWYVCIVTALIGWNRSTKARAVYKEDLSNWGSTLCMVVTVVYLFVGGKELWELWREILDIDVDLYTFIKDLL